MDVKTIPGSAGYYASIDGAIYDSDGKLRKTYKNGDGYITACILTDKGRYQTYGVHRLVAMAHIHVDGDISKLTVNHRDSDITNMIVSNLEWITVKLNNIHAALFRGTKSRPAIVAVSPDGNMQFIDSISKAAKMFSCDVFLIWDCIKDSVPLNGWYFKYSSNADKIPVSLRKPNFKEGSSGTVPGKAVWIKNIRDSSVVKYASMADAGRKHDVSPSHVYQAICTAKTKRLFQKEYLVSLDENFPTLSQEEFECLSRSCGLRIVAYNEFKRSIVFYNSASSFIRDNGLSKKAVTVDLKNKRLRRLKGWWYTYCTDTGLSDMKRIIAKSRSQ